MAAPSDTTWGNEIASGNNAGKIGISRTWSDQGNYEHADVTVWFWTKYGVTDSNNSFYYSRDTEPEYKGSVSIRTSSSSGSGWSEANQVIIATYSYDLPKAASDYTTYFNASITGIENLGGGNVSYVSRPYTVYALPAASEYYQVVYVRYQNADGTWGNYSAVISGNYTVGSTVSWSRGADAMYKAASISYTVSDANTRYVDVYRQTYVQTINVSYQNADGTFGNYSTDSSDSYYYGATVNKTFGGDVTYKTITLSYTVTGTATKYVDVYRNKYPIYFNSNGGVFTPSPQYYIYGGTTQLQKYRPTRSGYNLLGWSLNSDATNDTYSHKGNFTFDDSEPTLYAVWKKINQDIYLCNDGKCYVCEFIEDDVNGFGSGGRLYSPSFDENKSEDGTFYMNKTSFPASSFIEGLPT